MVPLSNSLEMLFMAVANANRKNPKLPALKVIAYLVLAVISTLKALPRIGGKTKPIVAKTNAMIMMPMNFFFRMFQSISYLTTAQNLLNQLGRGLEEFGVVVVIMFSLLGLL
jgi:hypothetical protein